MLTVAQFKVRFPEFTRQAEEYIQAALDEAYQQLDADVWGDSLDAGAGWLTAHTLAITPVGIAAGLATTRWDSNYRDYFRTLQRRVAGGAYLL